MITLALAAEDEAGARIARHVADAHCLRTDWIEPESLGGFRCWRSFDGHEWLRLHRIPAMSRVQFGNQFRLSGRFAGEAGAEDALLYRKLFVLLADLGAPIDIVIVARDVDGTARRRGLEQARADRVWPFDIVGALAQPEAEAWQICLWCAEDEPQRARHAALRQRLGFDPVQRSHELTSTSDSHRDAKRVLSELTETGRDGMERFTSASIETMRQCGTENGLRVFVEEVSAALDPHLGRPRSTS